MVGVPLELSDEPEAGLKGAAILRRRGRGADRRSGRRGLRAIGRKPHRAAAARTCGDLSGRAGGVPPRVRPYLGILAAGELVKNGDRHLAEHRFVAVLAHLFGASPRSSQARRKPRNEVRSHRLRRHPVGAGRFRPLPRTRLHPSGPKRGSESGPAARRLRQDRRRAEGVPRRRRTNDRRCPADRPGTLAAPPAPGVPGGRRPRRGHDGLPPRVLLPARPLPVLRAGRAARRENGRRDHQRHGGLRGIE